MCKITCPNCNYEIDFVRQTKQGAWTTAEDEQILKAYQTERKTIAQIADAINRTQDAVRNRLYQLRGAGKNCATFVVHTTPKEFEAMREGKHEAKQAKRELKKATAALKKISSLLSDSGFIRDFDEEFVITNKMALQEALYIAEDYLKEGLNNGRC